MAKDETVRATMLENIPGGKAGGDEAKKAPEPRILNEVDSLRVDVANLQQQVLQLRQESLSLKKANIALQEENLKLQADDQQENNNKLLSQLGLEGSVNLSKQSDGRYMVKQAKQGPNEVS